MEVEHIEQCLDIELREDSRSVQDRVWCLRIIWRRLNWIPGHIILGSERLSATFALIDTLTHHSLLGILGLRHARIASLEQLVDLIKVGHTMWS